MITIRVEGGDRLARTLRELPDRVNRRMQRDALMVAAEPIRGAAAAMAPRAPGAPDLADNIRISNARPEDGSVAVAIGPSKNFFYGKFQEFGTSRHGAQPFMRPAWDREGTKALQTIKSALWKALLRRGFGSARTSGGGGGLT
jgi:HK97 gp10 family phage protein